jgi:hypothetical protein
VKGVIDRLDGDDVGMGMGMCPLPSKEMAASPEDPLPLVEQPSFPNC